MRRRHLFEIEDQPWCPALLRDAMTAILEWIMRRGNYYAAIVPRLRASLEEAQAKDVLDLCSGGGGPWLALLPQLGADTPARVVLTDKFPNTIGAGNVSRVSGGRIVVEPRSIDATDVPADLRGFRTLFTALHHFRPRQASAILTDACRKGVGIGVFEFTERTPGALLSFCISPITVLFIVPFLRPFRWQWVFLTYLVPAIPLMALFDGIVSCFRTYSPSDLRDFVKPLERYGYSWQIGQDRSRHWQLPITYLIGYPATAARTD